MKTPVEGRNFDRMTAKILGESPASAQGYFG